MSIAQIQSLGKDLEAAKAKYNVSRMLEVLDNLDKREITTEILKKTQIGFTVNGLKKSQTNTQIVEKCTELIKKWKDIAKREKAAKSKKKTNNNNNDNSSSNNNNSNNNNNNNNSNNSNNSKDEVSNDLESKENDNDKNDELSIIEERPEMEWQTGIEYRDKIRKKLIAVLKPKTDYAHYMHYVDLAMKIEKEMFNEIKQKQGEKAYKSKFFDLGYNIKSNEELKLNLLRRQLEISKLITMTSQELASSKLKVQRSETKKWRLAEARSDNKKLSQMTDEYKCGKCGSRKVKYSQAQTRSADEPMTTFFACIECGNKWKQ